MKFPDLVPECVCTTPITVHLEDGLDEDGCPKKTVLFSGKCNYTQTDYPTTDAQQHKVMIAGVALFCGDPVPGRSLSGTAVVGVEPTERVIHAFSRAYNPDGTVNYTRVELR